MGYFMRNYGKYMIMGAIALIAIIVGVVAYSNMQAEKQKKLLVHRDEGIAYMKEEKYEDAVTAFQKALDISKGKMGEIEVDICLYQAMAQYRQGDTDAALETYTSVIDYNEDARAYFLRGNLYYSLEKEDKALADYDKAVKQDKNNYELYLSIYDILSEKGKEKEALNYLSQALEINSNKAEDKIYKGRVQVLAGEYENAIKVLSEITSENAEAYYYLYLAYSAQDNEELAMESLNSYMKADENVDSYQLYDMGKKLYEQEDYKTAIKCFEKALELDEVPNKQVVMKALVYAFEKTLDFTSAKEVMEQYVGLYPEDEEAYREYVFLQTR